MHISSDDEDNTYQVYLPQEGAVEEENGDENNEHSDEERDLDEGADIVNDPTFNAGNGFDDNKDCLQQDDKEDLLFDEAPAFSEHSTIRNAYVHAYIASAFKGASHDVSCIILDGVVHALWYARDHTRDIEYEAERCLGVNLDSIITYLFICPTCWQVHDPLMLYDKDLWEQCCEEDCEGILYTTKVLPYVTPHGDEPHQVPATDVGGDNAFADPSNPMHDMHDAWGNHSMGTLYMTCCNNPHGVRYLTEETFLIMVLPGPNEPNLEQLNKIMVKFVSDMIELYGGQEFQIYGHEDKRPVHSVLNSEVSNLPASCKIEGLASFSSKLFMCPQCNTPSYYLADPCGFNPTDFRLRDAWHNVKYAFRSHYLDDDDQKEIFEHCGVHWLVFNLIPGWLTAINSVVEFMHCVYLCMVRHVTKVIILQSGMLNPVTSSLSKADQWQLHISVLFVGLFIAWEIDSIIPNVNAPKLRANTKHAATHVKNEKVMSAQPTDEQLDENDALTMDCSIRHHYTTILEFSAAIWILSSCSISPDEVKWGCAALSRACQNWAHMGCHLTPYFHLAQHLQCQFLQFGPCYATWVTNHNNHKGSELECIMMCKWWKWVLVHDLVYPQALCLFVLGV
ncbi:uncharacterized protein BJ212DRAFT_1446741 [Suillus subaureus]|uniref:Uncharacterized protein n=1 Tax=Suillus subaureus TaxID=48587 RepID=A0A9P7JEA0_9AGAM|nr:uncharacterized protein BJ212DRAFT_1446741 [Suillus subaureus]KAG1817167.1 hypothetical protein BJ212DRAFT_1446741 [Suillus subaureus]